MVTARSIVRTSSPDKLTLPCTAASLVSPRYFGAETHGACCPLHAPTAHFPKLTGAWARVLVQSVGIIDKSEKGEKKYNHPLSPSGSCSANELRQQRECGAGTGNGGGVAWSSSTSSWCPVSETHHGDPCGGTKSTTTGATSHVGLAGGTLRLAHKLAQRPRTMCTIDNCLKC